jgi:hypothetical protein
MVSKKRMCPWSSTAFSQVLLCHFLLGHLPMKSRDSRRLRCLEKGAQPGVSPTRLAPTPVDAPSSTCPESSLSLPYWVSFQILSSPGTYHVQRLKFPSPCSYSPPSLNLLHLHKICSLTSPSPLACPSFCQFLFDHNPFPIQIQFQPYTWTNLLSSPSVLCFFVLTAPWPSNPQLWLPPTTHSASCSSLTLMNTAEGNHTTYHIDTTTSKWIPAWAMSPWDYPFSFLWSVIRPISLFNNSKPSLSLMSIPASKY